MTATVSDLLEAQSEVVEAAREYIAAEIKEAEATMKAENAEKNYTDNVEVERYLMDAARAISHASDRAISLRQSLRALSEKTR